MDQIAADTDTRPVAGQLRGTRPDGQRGHRPTGHTMGGRNHVAMRHNRAAAIVQPVDALENRADGRRTAHLQ